MPIIFADEILHKQKDVAHIPIGPVGELSTMINARRMHLHDINLLQFSRNNLGAG